MQKRRIAASVLIAVLVMAVAGCDFARVGAKCKVGAPLARDTTHVLYCKNGKWARLVTVEQATQIVIGTLPGSATVQNLLPITPVVGGGTFNLEVKVLRRNGNVSPDTLVDVSGPGSGASVTGNSSAKTDASGIARVPLTANGSLGTYDLTVKVNGAPDAKVAVTNVPVLTVDSDKSARPVKVGDRKTVTFRTTDAAGTPLAGVTIDLDKLGGVIVPSVVTGAEGFAFASFTAAGKAGQQVLRAHASGATVDAPLNVTPGNPARLEFDGGQQITVGQNRVSHIPPITVLDIAGNPVPFTTVTYSLQPSGGRTAEIDDTSRQTDANGTVAENAFQNNGGIGSFGIGVSASAGLFVTFTINVVLI